MKELVIKAENWVDDTITAQVAEREGDTQKFFVHEEEYELHFSACEFNDGGKYDTFLAIVHSKAHDGDKLFGVTRFRDDTNWEALCMDFSRTGGTPVEAAVKMLAMIV